MLFLKLVILPLRLFLPCLRRIAIFDPAIYDFILSTMSRDAGLSKDELLAILRDNYESAEDLRLTAFEALQDYKSRAASELVKNYDAGYSRAHTPDSDSDQ